MHSLPAEGILTVGHTSRHHAVADEDDTMVAKRAEGKPHRCGMDVNAIGNELYRFGKVSCRANQPRGAV